MASVKEEPLAPQVTPTRRATRRVSLGKKIGLVGAAAGAAVIAPQVPAGAQVANEPAVAQGDTAPATAATPDTTAVTPVTAAPTTAAPEPTAPAPTAAAPAPTAPATTAAATPATAVPATDAVSPVTDATAPQTNADGSECCVPTSSTSTTTAPPQPPITECPEEVRDFYKQNLEDQSDELTNDQQLFNAYYDTLNKLTAGIYINGELRTFSVDEAIHIVKDLCGYCPPDIPPPPTVPTHPSTSSTTIVEQTTTTIPQLNDPCPSFRYFVDVVHNGDFWNAVWFSVQPDGGVPVYGDDSILDSNGNIITPGTLLRTVSFYNPELTGEEMQANALAAFAECDRCPPVTTSTTLPDSTTSTSTTLPDGTTTTTLPDGTTTTTLPDGTTTTTLPDATTTTTLPDGTTTTTLADGTTTTTLPDGTTSTTLPASSTTLPPSSTTAVTPVYIAGPGQPPMTALPRTGSESGDLAKVGVALIATGAAAVGIGRSRANRSGGNGPERGNDMGAGDGPPFGGPGSANGILARAALTGSDRLSALIAPGLSGADRLSAAIGGRGLSLS